MVPSGDYATNQGSHIDEAVRRISACEVEVLGSAVWARGYFCARVGQMTEEMIKQYLDHHFEPSANDDFRMEPD